ncbi:MAG: sugar ABC transporter permease [Oscillospiraceae bacterium]|nr:sugar ABC transporter permease [Oscillospiraceae bacterium]
MKQSSANAGFIRRNRHFLYILPWMLGFLIFRAFPMLYSLICGFTDFHLFRGMHKTGLMNYIQIMHDPDVLHSIALTVKFACISVPLRLCTAMLAALLLNRMIRGIRLFRTLYYLPSILGGSVAAAVLWKAMFRDHGTVNAILTALHLPAMTWLADSRAALWVIILLRVWEFGAPMLMFLAALQQIPNDLTDAAKLDGAGAVRCFFRVRLPMISSVVFYNLMLGFCTALQEFNAPFVITGGGPRGATTLFSLLLYRSAFTENQMGYACALAWVLFLLSAAFSAAFLLLRRKLVYDPDEGGAA